jgi:8-oxo-dGTP pyrophosphatase MutT (NUDIX family)
MNIDSRLNDIDDCLYRVATKALIVSGDKVLLVKEIPEMYWGFPGGGVDHGETIETSLVRELEEELGVSAQDVTTDYKIAHHTIGTVVDNIPRMNVFYKVGIPEQSLKKTDHVAEWQWFTREEFMKSNMSPSYKDRTKLAEVIFGK